MSNGRPDAKRKDAAPLDADEFARIMAACGEAGEHVAVGVSGGADSMALGLLLSHWGQAFGVQVTALTVDHALRAGSKAEAAQVGTWLSSHTLDHHILTWHHEACVTSAVQARARDARYRLMGDWCRANGVTRLLTAHHQGDQAETVLMRLKKGTTLFGLAAMETTRDLDGIALCRPLLAVPKARLIATLHALGQDWVEDPSNHNQAYERVRVRQHLDVLASEGVTAARLAGAARGARAVREILDGAADTLIEAHTELRGQGVAVAASFWDAPDVVCGRALAKVLTCVGATTYAPSPAKLERLYAWMARGPGASGGRTLGGCLVRPKGADFLISPQPPRKRPVKVQKSGLYCAEALAPEPQKPYIQS